MKKKIEHREYRKYTSLLFNVHTCLINKKKTYMTPNCEILYICTFMNINRKKIDTCMSSLNAK